METLRLDFKNSGVTEKDIVRDADNLEEYRAYMQRVVEQGDFAAPEASLCLPSDTLSFQAVEDMVLKYKKKNLKYVVVVGIGGSSLGTLAIYDAIFGTYDAFDTNRLPKLLFLDTTSEKKLSSVIALLERGSQNSRSFVINVVSKSGRTTETISNFEVLYKELTKHFGDIADRIVVTADKGSQLWDQAEKLGFSRLPIQKRVGGRYSIFSAVGLFPLGLAGVNTRELLEGAKVMIERCLSPKIEENPALMSSLAMHTGYIKDITIHNNFFFAPEMESIGKWHRQLMGESLGKKRDIKGNILHAGITPIISVGSTDLHSVAQLFFAGPRDKFTTMVAIRDTGSVLKIPEAVVLEGLVEDINGRSIHEIMQAIIFGVRETYQDLSLPFMFIEMPDVSAFSLGQYFQFQMMKVMYLAKLMRINAFNQPGVEQYKIATRKALMKKR